jgi:hypothetical protein
MKPFFFFYDVRSVIFLQQWLYCMNIDVFWCLILYTNVDLECIWYYLSWTYTEWTLFINCKIHCLPFVPVINFKNKSYRINVKNLWYDQKEKQTNKEIQNNVDSYHWKVGSSHIYSHRTKIWSKKLMELSTKPELLYVKCYDELINSKLFQHVVNWKVKK